MTLLTLGTLALMLVQFERLMSLTVHAPGIDLVAFRQAGTLALFTNSAPKTSPAPGFFELQTNIPSQALDALPLSFYLTFDWGSSPTGVHIRIPLLYPAILLILCTTVLWWKASPYTIQIVRRSGCPACGYDLQGLPAAAPCPECGGATSLA